MGALAFLKYHYSFCHFTYSVVLRLVLQQVLDTRMQVASDESRRQSQVGSLAGAAHLLNDNAGVLRRAQ